MFKYQRETDTESPRLYAELSDRNFKRRRDMIFDKEFDAVKLDDEVLGSVAGGLCGGTKSESDFDLDKGEQCPLCKTTNTCLIVNYTPAGSTKTYTHYCTNCKKYYINNTRDNSKYFNYYNNK